MHRIISSAVAVVVGLAASGAFAATTIQPIMPKIETIHVDESSSTALDEGCRYNVRVSGEIRAAKPSAAETRAVLPDLVINADLQCANGATLLRPNVINGTGPLTRAQLEQMIEERATLTSPDARGRCEYAPDFNLSADRLSLRAVEWRCPIG